MARLPFRTCVALLGLLVASASQAAILTITPDKSVYQVGELIVLDVFGDPEDDIGGFIMGHIFFSESLANFESASQWPMTSFGGLVTFTLGELSHLPGIVEAFNQAQSTTANPADCCLMAQVVLRALSPGELTFEWGEEGLPLGSDRRLRFFGLTQETAPGVDVTIVPEPSSLTLLLLGLIGLAREKAHLRKRS